MDGLPRDFPVRTRGSCVPAAVILSAKYALAVVVEGYVGVVVPSDEHTWIEFGEEIIDPTIRQFKWWRKGVSVVREPKLKRARTAFLTAFKAKRACDPDAREWWKRFDRWMRGYL